MTAEAGFDQQARLLNAWFLALEATKKAKAEAIIARNRLDVERFIDEHRAYAAGLKSAWSLVKDYPDYFCRVWVPSYQEKKPVRFYQAFTKLEAQFSDGSFSEWLGNEYTFVATNYLQTSLYKSGEKGQGLKPDVLRRASEAIRLEFPLGVQ
jgi:hypothetical protein